MTQIHWLAFDPLIWDCCQKFQRVSICILMSSTSVINQRITLHVHQIQFHFHFSVHTCSCCPMLYCLSASVSLSLSIPRESVKLPLNVNFNKLSFNNWQGRLSTKAQQCPTLLQPLSGGGSQNQVSWHMLTKSDKPQMRVYCSFLNEASVSPVHHTHINTRPCWTPQEALAGWSSDDG